MLLQRRPFPDQFSIEILFESLCAEFKKLGCDVSLLIAPHYSKGLWPRMQDVLWAHRVRGDICHVTGDVHFLALGLPHRRTVLTIHDCFQLERLTGFKRWVMRLLWFSLPVRCAAKVTVISEETKRQLLRYVSISDDKIVVVPDSVSSIFRPCPKPFNSNSPQVLHVGTKPNKNLPRLIEALRGLNCRLKVIGILDKEQLKLLRHSKLDYETAENVSVTEMFKAYCDADIVSFTSIYEGFGMPIIEAQWVERPVVTSNCSSMPEIAGEGACFVNPFDIQSIRCGLRRVIEDQEFRESIIEHGRKNRQRFSFAAIARQYLSVYQQLAATCVTK